MNKYQLIKEIGNGTFSEVFKGQSIKTGKFVAIKCMKNHFDSLDQVENLREIQALKRLSPHAHVIKLLEVLYDEPTGRLALVFELMEMNMYELIRGRRHYLPEGKVKGYMYQLLKAMDHMHRHGVFHRDIKPENILLQSDVVKLADFGSCRGIYARPPYTEYISTRWYRAPECLLTDGYYNYKMDVWGVGCVFFEVLSLFPLFPGSNELDQVHKIHNILGTPQQDLLERFKKHATHMDFNFPQKTGTGISKLIPHVSADCQDLIKKMLAYNPDDRLTARQALKHAYFRDIRERERPTQLNMQVSLRREGGADRAGGESKEEAPKKLSQTVNLDPKKGQTQSRFPEIKGTSGHVSDDKEDDSQTKNAKSLPHNMSKYKKVAGARGNPNVGYVDKGHVRKVDRKYVSPYSQKKLMGAHK
mmetsp:Transcript_16035/g.17940  ORF Transcript_16035/g.17940 Transcript_16035/m.17940 type:complete len:417 (+) Transcript_16035:36-1286(+)